jgi:class 3 adenylate cyclase
LIRKVNPEKIPGAVMFRFSLRTKIFLAMAMVAAVVAIAAISTHYALRRRELLGEFSVFVRGVAGTTAMAIEGRDLSGLRDNADADSPAFLRVRSILDRSRRINGLRENEIYILRPVEGSANPWTMEFVVMLQKKTFIGDRYTIREENRAVFEAAWKTGEPQNTRVYRDEYGEWISGYMPIFDAGKPVAVLEVDAEISRFVARQRTDLIVGLMVGCGAFLVAMVPGLLLARSLTRGLRQLADGIHDFRAGDDQVQVHVATGDELQELSTVFNEMILSLRERLALLPFVSRFTAEAVRRSKDDPSWLSGSEQNVIVLFADLRGFTAFSEAQEAGQLVQELNRLLTVQANIVVSAGGDVDKFIGDAVMAVFLEDGNSADAIFACAVTMIDTVRSETKKQKWPLGLGVGIHCGRAVVGSIGSDTRRDFTAIGHTVNLASHLCDRASRWEILVSEEFYAKLSAGSRERFEARPPMRFKNVAHLVTVHACRVDVSSPAGFD